MLETQYRRIEQLDSVEDYASTIRGRRMRLMYMLLAVVSIACGIILVVRLKAPNALLYSPLMALAALSLIALPVVVWNNPRVGLYLLALSASLCIQNPVDFVRDPFEYIPIFWNISQIGEHYAGTKALGAVYFNFGEVLMVMTALFYLMRQVTLRQMQWHWGAFFGWLALYVAWAGVGYFRGISAGAYYVTALWELRAQAYFFIAYMLATNMINDKQHVRSLIWVLLVGFALKSLVGTANFIKNPHVSADEGVLSHEDSLFMNFIMFGALTFSLAKVEPKLKWAFLIFLPTALIANMANQRRAAIAAFVVAFPIVIMMMTVLLKDRRKVMYKFITVFLVGTAIYLPVAWNATGPWALPARAIRSKFSPDPRDAASDLYRMAENNNLKLTRDLSPIFGYGYGRPFIEAFKMWGRDDPFKTVLPHNGVLWIWMRLGHVGFFFFWMFVATVLVRGPNLLKAIKDPFLQVAGIMAIASFLMLIIYGEFDLCFANYRAMWLAGTLLGMMAAMPRFANLEEGQPANGPMIEQADDTLEEEETELVVSQDGRWRKGVPGWQRGTEW